MSDCVREMTSKELLEISNLDNKEKDLILSRLKAESERNYSATERYEKTISEQRYLIESYRTVLADMVYSNWFNK